MNIIEALRDGRLLGALPTFSSLDTWGPWLTFLKAVYGLPMDSDDLARFRQHTGRTAPRPGGYLEAAAIVGRQAGKSQIASALATFEAATSEARGSHVVLVAQDLRGAQRVLLSYAKEAFEVPALKAEVIRETADTLELQNGISLSVYPSRPRSVRGIRSPLVILDELAHMLSTEGNPVDVEMLQAVRPTLATTNGRLLILSSPYWESGALFDLHRAHYGREDSDILIWQASADAMNPTLSESYLSRMRQGDPEAALSEVEGLFRAGTSQFFDPAALQACVDVGVHEREPSKYREHVAFADAASGSGQDAFGLLRSLFNFCSVRQKRRLPIG